jgi:hypothetical protein
MNEPPDPLEAELAALPPHDVSPELRRRVAERLADVPPRRRRRVLWLAVAGGLAAACLAAVALWWGLGRHVEPDRPVVRNEPAPPAEASPPGPTLLAYQRALARSPEALDALLDQDAAAIPGPEPELLRAGVFSRPDATLYPFQGDD